MDILLWAGVFFVLFFMVIIYLAFQMWKGTNTPRPMKNDRQSQDMHFNQGYLSKEMITDEAKQEAILVNPYVLLVDIKIEEVIDLMPLLEKVNQTNRPLFIMVKDIDEEVLATLVVNKVKGSFVSVAVQGPEDTQQRKALFQEIVQSTASHVIKNKQALQKAKLSHLGQVKSVIVDDRNTRITLK